MKSSKPKPPKRKKRTKEELEEEITQRMMESRLTFLWIQDLERQAKITKKAHQLAKKRRVGYIA